MNMNETVSEVTITEIMRAIVELEQEYLYSNEEKTFSQMVLAIKNEIQTRVEPRIKKSKRVD